VDIITGAPNIGVQVPNATFTAWYKKRLFTQEYLRSRNLLGNMTVTSKTYPSNSGQSPWGAEKVVMQLYNHDPRINNANR